MKLTSRENPHVNSKGKIPSTGKKKISPDEDRTHNAASSRTVSPTHYQRVKLLRCTSGQLDGNIQSVDADKNMMMVMRRRRRKGRRRRNYYYYYYYYYYY